MNVNRDLFIDLSARLPYGVRGTVPVEVATGHYDMIDGSMEYEEKDILVELVGIGDGEEIDLMILEKGWEDYDLSDYNFLLDDFVPLLRPLSSMTEDEKNELNKHYLCITIGDHITLKYHSEGYWDNDTETEFKDYLWLENWFNEHHFDFRGLIPKNLATAVTEENNPYVKD